MSDDKFSFYKEYPKTCAPTDFWGQVKRTVNGVPVSEEQIQLIVDAVLAALSLQNDDVLLDLCCGNGALTDRLLCYCSSGLGVDFSPYLINVAKSNFENLPTREFVLQDIVTFCETCQSKERFTKAFCYGSFSYLDPESAKAFLGALNKKFRNISRVFIGNLPDRDKVFEFFSDKNYFQGIEEKPDSSIGIWRSQSEFQLLAEQCGWHVEFSRMPTNYYAAHYRYDVVLTRL